MRDENDLSYELENLAMSRFDIDPWKHETEAYNWVKEKNEKGRFVTRRDVDARRWPSALRRRRCARDAWASRLLVEADYEQAQRALIEYTHRTAMILERINLSGAIVDMGKFEAFDTDLGLQVSRARDLLTKAAAQARVEGFVPTNDTHIRQLLYDKLSLPVLAKTKSGLPAVDKNTLKDLGRHAVLDLLLEFNKLDKLYTVNIAGVSERITPCPVAGSRRLGYLPFRINPLGARTGRRSASRPNSQNWPESIRGIITSRFPGGQILNADYAKLEVVLIAWVAGDDKLLAAFTGGRGYIDVARELFGRDVENGTDEYRAVKSIVLGVHYNMQTPKMARQLALLGIKFSEDWDAHEKETDRLRLRYLHRFQGIGRYMEAREQYWLRTGTSRSYTGRVRHLPVPESGGKGYGHMLNQAINFPIQSLASDVTASALLDFEEAMLREAGLNYSEYLALLIDQRNFLTTGRGRGIIPHSQIINEVHDSVVVDIHPDHVKRDQEMVIECMRAVKSLRALAPGFDHTILNADWKLATHWKSK
jgi:DNA polymerase I-like protein with 3'-5' exonuclease and polymerase domains